MIAPAVYTVSKRHSWYQQGKEKHFINLRKKAISCIIQALKHDWFLRIPEKVSAFYISQSSLHFSTWLSATFFLAFFPHAAFYFLWHLIPNHSSTLFDTPRKSLQRSSGEPNRRGGRGVRSKIILSFGIFSPVLPSYFRRFRVL